MASRKRERRVLLLDGRPILGGIGGSAFLRKNPRPEKMVCAKKTEARFFRAKKK